MDICTVFNFMLESMKKNDGIDDDIFNEFILRFNQEYSNCQNKLSKKFSSFLENNEFLHDSEILDVSIVNYYSNQRYLYDVVMKIKPYNEKSEQTITYKQVNKFVIERYEEKNSRWTWGYGYLKKLEDDSLEQGIICFPITLIRINCKNIILK